MAMKHRMTRDDLIDVEDYARDRKAHKARILEIKKNRRMEVGPVCCFYFENFDTIWSQVHEMLFIERGGEEQIADELAAYGTLIPKGAELVATVMFEIDDPQRRQTFLSKLGGVEETAFLRLGGETVSGRPEEDVDRTTAAGKASSVQFIHFPMTGAQARAFKEAGQEVVIGFTHPQYAHMAVMPEAVRAALAEDLD